MATPERGLRGGTATDLARLADVLAYLSERDVRIAGGIPEVVPTILGGTIDPSRTFHLGGVGTLARSIPDQASPQGAKDYFQLMDHSRRLQTFSPEWWMYGPAGRILWQDTFRTAAAHYITGAGTLTTAVGAGDVFDVMNTASKGLKIQAVDVAGSTGIARKFLLNNADLPLGAEMHVVLGCYVKWGSNTAATEEDNLRSFQLFFRTDDGTSKFEAAIRYHLRQVGVAQQNFQVLDSAGNFQTVNNYAVDIANDGRAWHLMIMAMKVKQNPAPSLEYHAIKFDDFTFKEWGTSSTTKSARSVATDSVRQCSFDLLAEDDAAAVSVSSAVVGAVWVADLTTFVTW